MATIVNSGNESEGSIAALEGACLFDNMDSPMEHTPLGAGKTPTTPSRVADLAAVVDGGSGIQRSTVRPARGDSYHLFMLEVNPLFLSFLWQS